MAEIVPFFAVPFAFADCENCASLNYELRRLFAQRAAAGAEYANALPLTQRNAQVFESRFDLFRWPERCVQQLKEFCLRNLLQLVCEINGYDEAMARRLLIQHDSWFHLTQRGGFFGLHNHPNASWSGVYCVDPGHHDEGKLESGLLSFVSPMATTGMFVDAATRGRTGAYASNGRQVRLTPGQLVLFPSWVLHDVKPYEGDGDRITVSFNCWFGLEEAGAVDSVSTTAA